MKLWQIGLFLLACTPRETTPLITVATTPLATPTATTTEALKPATTGIEIACSYALESLELDAATPLCAQRNIDCFINLKSSVHGKLVVMVPTGAVTHFVSVLELGAARFRGQVASTYVHVGPKAPTVIDGWIVPLALGSLRIERAETAAVEVGLESTQDFEILRPIRVRWACDRLAFSAMTEPPDVLDMLVPHASRKGTRVLTGVVPVSRDPGGDVVARFQTSDAIELVETKGASSRILARSSNAAFVGWVPTSMVAPQTTGVGYGTGHGRLGGSHYASGKKCEKDIPLYARIGQRLVVVGEIMASRYFAVEDSDGRKIVDVRSSAFDLLPNVSLEVMPQDLAPCSSR